ncbi:FecR family protein [Dyadobacter sp. SG02]|uniref:FecR family protein n=1 Tax=Dyadobacter sp. SG02 TaxID=1855291 RepID=UPI0008AEC320|nr:FecR family protein [Dyadobacter sp. SG02]SEJ73408.1 FecR family protein [Dyadobacter sp. SG02]
MDRPDYDLNAPEDFLQNNRFRDWVKHRSLEDKIFWEDFLNRYPEKRPAYEKAVAMLLVIFGNAAEEAQDAGEGAGRLREMLSAATGIDPAETDSSEPLPLWRWLRWSAAAVLVIGLGFWWSRAGRDSRIAGKGIAVIGNSASGEWIIRENQSQTIMLVNLPDGSSVLLSKGSSIRFVKEMNGAERDVFLDGEGFFEVVKNPAKPFLVHTDKLTTRVLGTSFRVKSFPGQAEAEVAVKTGKVAVLADGDDAAKSLMLYPNQRVSLIRKNDRLVSSVTGPARTEATIPIEIEPFNFQFTPVSEAFKTLETHYAVKILFDVEKMSQCTVTASLKDEPFLEKVRLICLATEASFIVDGDIVSISGAGCP